MRAFLSALWELFEVAVVALSVAWALWAASTFGALCYDAVRRVVS